MLKWIYKDKRNNREGIHYLNIVAEWELAYEEHDPEESVPEQIKWGNELLDQFTVSTIIMSIHYYLLANLAPHSWTAYQNKYERSRRIEKLSNKTCLFV